MSRFLAACCLLLPAGFAPAADSVALELALPRAQYNTAEPIEFAVFYKNEGGNASKLPLEVKHADGSSLTFQVPFDVAAGKAAVAQRVVDRVVREASPERVKKLLTDALLLTGLRVRRDVAVRIFQGVRAMQESDTYLMILEEGQEKQAKKSILVVGEDRFGPPEQSVRDQLESITNLERLDRMFRRALRAAGWQEILDTP